MRQNGRKGLVVLPYRYINLHHDTTLEIKQFRCYRLVAIVQQSFFPAMDGSQRKTASCNCPLQSIPYILCLRLRRTADQFILSFEDDWYLLQMYMNNICKRVCLSHSCTAVCTVSNRHRLVPLIGTVQCQVVSNQAPHITSHLIYFQTTTCPYESCLEDTDYSLSPFIHLDNFQERIPCKGRFCSVSVPNVFLPLKKTINVKSFYLRSSGPVFLSFHSCTARSPSSLVSI